MSETPEEFPTSITFTPTASALTFYGGDTRVWLTISPDGVMTIGPGLSEDEATQGVAAMLAHHYSALHRDQAVRIAALSAALEPFAKEADARAQLVLGQDIDHWPIGGSALTLGDIRRAREALAPPQTDRRGA